MEPDAPRSSGSHAVVGHWIHSHEEDTGDTEVYRPAGYPFPLSRGRRGFELRPGGTVRYDEIGRTDRPEFAEGSWKLDRNGNIRLDFEGRPSVVLEVVTQSDDELRLRTRAVDG